jgi:hypothetical protein
MAEEGIREIGVKCGFCYPLRLCVVIGLAGESGREGLMETSGNQSEQRRCGGEVEVGTTALYAKHVFSAFRTTNHATR